MADAKRIILSSSTNGRGIRVAATATPGTAVHTAHNTDIDEVWLWAVNNGSANRLLTLEFGGVTDPDDHIEVAALAAQDIPTLVCPGFSLTGGLAVRAFADAANDVEIFGYVNRILQ